MTVQFPDGVLLILTNGGLFFAAVVIIASLLLTNTAIGVLADLYREGRERREHRYERRQNSVAAGEEGQ